MPKFHSIALEPTSDIILSLEPGEVGQTDIKVIKYFEDQPFEDISNKCTITLAEAGVPDDDKIVGLQDRALTARNPGITFIHIAHDHVLNPEAAPEDAKGSRFQLVARVTVCSKIDQIWLGNNGTARVNNGADNLVLTVYASYKDPNGGFEDLVGDVTGMGYVVFESGDNGNASVHAASGRVTGKRVGTETIIAKFKGAELAKVEVTVVPALNEARPILERVMFNGIGPQFRNILFLAEGFTDDQHGKFRSVVNRITWKMRGGGSSQPFQLLKRDYNAWSAFEASREAGASIGPYVNREDGRLSVIDEVRVPDSYALLAQVKDSAHGLMYGKRLGDKEAVIRNLSAPGMNRNFRGIS
jgi:hypothetical protein